MGLDCYGGTSHQHVGNTRVEALPPDQVLKFNLNMEDTHRFCRSVGGVALILSYHSTGYYHSLPDAESGGRVFGWELGLGEGAESVVELQQAGLPLCLFLSD